MRVWKPTIEGLPESGVEVLVARGKAVTIAMYAGKFDLHCDSYGYIEDVDYDDESEEFWPEGWYELAYDENINRTWWLGTDKEFTHWMPLPEPPEGAAP